MHKQYFRKGNSLVYMYACHDVVYRYHSLKNKVHPLFLKTQIAVYFGILSEAQETNTTFVFLTLFYLSSHVFSGTHLHALFEPGGKGIQSSLSLQYFTQHRNNCNPCSIRLTVDASAFILSCWKMKKHSMTAMPKYIEVFILESLLKIDEINYV